ncbi:hypothetical protein TTHERM_00391420 (macronuclear) [Tetrahymena thermophila SB210]|uniref:Uncharacterized protein n=1 Tax=Tetrahymena thermophila (strain SB210) TaxID=312017 RepID=Q233K8_TETTS|nr:hypothetical protein TTHERM_00391420 [Tetrahymena thermophila SB210]EAR91572.4 hypothetical protein TTHERM_00391420 [Tetrahymena thermophila SB210]|eukprot:XP_001011817.4 hypothetical protein TTHERM_00391420 [Tetrahymena thermophila SB210]
MSSKQMQTILDLQRQLQQYKYPSCSRHVEKDYLNMICMDKRCDEDCILDPFCSICTDRNNHRKAYHVQHNLKNILKDVLDQTQEVQVITEADSSYVNMPQTEFEVILQQLGKEFQIFGQECFKVAETLFRTIEKYRLSKIIKCPEKPSVQKIIAEILEKGDEGTLRRNLKKLLRYGEVQNEQLILNPSNQTVFKDQIEKNAKTYIKMIEQGLEQLGQIRFDLFVRGIRTDFDEIQLIKNSPLKDPSSASPSKLRETPIDPAISKYFKSTAESPRDHEAILDQRIKQAAKTAEQEKALNATMNAMTIKEEVRSIQKEIENVRQIAVDQANQQSGHASQVIFNIQNILLLFTPNLHHLLT